VHCKKKNELPNYSKTTNFGPEGSDTLLYLSSSAREDHPAGVELAAIAVDVIFQLFLKSKYCPVNLLKPFTDLS